MRGKIAASSWLLPFALSLGFWQAWIALDARGDWVISWPWVPSLGLNLTFYVDALSLLFLLMVTVIGTLVGIYAEGDLKDHPKKGRFVFLLWLFMFAMIGLVSSGHLLLLFLFWEMTGIASFLLIGFKSDQSTARRGASQALLVTSLGGLCLLGGFILLARAAGSWELAEIIQAGDRIRESPLYEGALILILLGAFTKSAQMPFHFWLPNAMAAPTPVSAYLHSATMVKAGIYLIARLNPALGGTELWHGLLLAVGSVTAVGGPLLALRESDLKRLLAGSTIGALGLLVLLFGLGSESAMQAAVVYLLVHSLYKAALFMVAGAVNREMGTRNIKALDNLIFKMPFTAIAAVLAALSMAGFPPLLGFMGKEMIYQAKLEAAHSSLWIAVMGLFANSLMVAVAFIVGIEPFVGKKIEARNDFRETKISLWLGPMLLALGGLVIGLLQPSSVMSLLAAAAERIWGASIPFSIKPWHGFGPVFFLSLATLAFGVLLFSVRRRLRWLLIRGEPLEFLQPERLYFASLKILQILARSLTFALQGGRLSFYTGWIFFCVLLFMGFWAGPASSEGTIPATSLYGDELGLALLVMTAGFFLMLRRDGTLTVILMGVIGNGLALLYVLHSAPDVGIAQFLAETLSVVLTLFLISELPQARVLSSRPLKVLKAGIAAMLALGMGHLAWRIASTASATEPVSGFFNRHSLSEAYGRNIVNVILVDFRGFDTLAEITVLSLAAVSVLLLLRPLIRKNPGKEAR